MIDEKDLIKDAEEICNEVFPKANTAIRIGSWMLKSIAWVKSLFSSFTTTLEKKADTTNANGTVVRTPDGKIPDVDVSKKADLIRASDNFKVAYSVDGKIPEADIKVYTIGELVDRLTSGKYTNAHNGLSYTSVDYHSSEFIKVHAGQKLLITGTFGYNPTDVTMIAGVAGYSSENENTFVAPVFSPEMAGASKQGRYTVEDFEVTVPIGVNYIKGSSVFATKVLSIKDPTTESISVVVPDLMKSVNKLTDDSTVSNDIILETVDVESGSFGLNGSLSVDNTRLRTINYYAVSDIFNVTSINVGFKYRIIGWKKGIYISMADWSSAVKSWDLAAYGFTEIKIAFCKDSNAVITVSEFANIGFKASSITSLKYLVQNIGGGSNVTDGIITRNQEAEKAVRALCKQFKSQSNTNETEIAFFAHTSDMHGDAKRLENFITYCEHLKVDAAFVTGDIVVQYYNDDFSYYKNRALATNLKMYHVTGNHENERGTNESDVMQHARFFAGLDVKNGMKTESKGYYYTDFATKKTRVIGLNQFQYGGATREKRYLKDDQITWFINTLKSTPAGFGIVLLTHIPEHEWVQDADFGKFWQKTIFYDDLMNNTTGSPIADIIDAFITRATISKTYAQNGTLTTLSVSADFSTGVNSGVEFIAYANGHVHADRIGYLKNTTRKQLVLNVICGNAFVGNARDALGDMPRMSGTVAEDAFNVYGIDRTLGAVKIARVGSNINYMMEKRDYLVIPYK